MDGEPEGLTFLLTHLAINPGDGRYPGLDLDGIDTLPGDVDSTTCSRRSLDMPSTFADATSSVDNQVAYVGGLMGVHPGEPEPPADLRERMDRLIASGDYVLVVHFPAGELEDGAVSALVGFARPSCAGPAPQACAPCAVGAEYVLDQRVYVSELEPVDASVSGGVVTLEISALAVPNAAMEWYSGAPLDPATRVEVRAAQLRFDTTAERDFVAVGARWGVDDVAAFSVGAYASDMSVSEWHDWWEPWADLGASAASVAPCTAFSVGWEAELVRVQAVIQD